jgi:hypothetical protein
MAGMAGGFLQGYTQTALALHKYKEEREREAQELALKKEDLALRRDVLKGQEASRALQDNLHRLTIQKTLHDLLRTGTEARREQEATDLLNTPAGPADGNETPRHPGSDPGDPPASASTASAVVGPAQQPGNTAAMYHRLIAEIGKSDGFAPEVIQHAQALIEPESNFNPDAVSPKGATGLMQLMPATQQRYGVADPLNPLQNIRGGLRVLQDLYRRFPGRPDLVSAAYNAGEGAVQDAGNAVPNYPETQAYVKKVGANLARPATPDVSQMTAGPGAPTPSPLLRSPGVPLEPAQQQEWAALNGRLEQLQQQRAQLDAAWQQLMTLGQRSQGLATTKAFKERAEILKQAFTLNQQESQTLLQQRQQLIEPAVRIETSRVQGETGARIAAQKAAETEKGQLQGKQEFKESQTLLDVDRQTSRQYFDTQTGQPLAQSSRYSDVQARMGQGQVVFLDDQEAKDYRGIQKMVPLLQKIKGQLEKVYGPGGIFANLKPEERLSAALTGLPARLLQTNPDLVALERNLRGNVDLLRRNLQGQVGTQTDRDAQRGLEALPKPGGIPDSQEVAYGMYNSLLEVVNGMLGTYLGNDAYQESRLTPLQIRARASDRDLATLPVDQLTPEEVQAEITRLEQKQKGK